MCRTLVLGLSLTAALTACDQPELIASSVTEVELADGSVSTPKLADGAVDAAKLGASAAGTEHLQDGSVTDAKLADDSVKSNHVSEGVILARHLDPDLVNGGLIPNNSVTTNHIVDKTIGSRDLANSSVGEDQLQDEVITFAKLANGAVQAAKIAYGAISGEHIENGAITGDKIADGAVGTAAIDGGAVVSGHLADGAVTSAKIGGGAVGSGHIAGNAVNSGHLTANSVGASEIASNAVGSSEIGANAVGNSELQDYLAVGDASSAGQMWAYDGANSNPVVKMWYGGGIGSLTTFYGASGNKSTTLSRISGKGYIGVNNDDGSCCEAGMYIDGSGRGIVFGNVKSFVEEHPLDPEMRIVYAAVEGPEAAAYFRGTAQLEGGAATVYFPEHFMLTASEQGMTATVTPTSAASLGLAVTEVTPEFMTVEELGNGDGDYSFHYRVEAVRAGYEDFEVIRHKSDFEGQ